MKRRIVLILSISIIFIALGIQIYYFIGFKGNLVLYVTNQSILQDTIDVKISVDDKQVLDDILITGNYHLGKIFSIKAPLGKHNLYVQSQTLDMNKTYSFKLWLINFIMIEVYDNDEGFNVDHKQKLVFTKRISPFILQ